MLDLTLPKQKPIPASVYAEFFRARQPPAGTVVWAGAYAPARSAAQARRGIVQARVTYPEADSASILDFHVATFSALRVIFQVLTPFPGQPNAPAALPESETRLAAIWPAHSASLDWPPSSPALPQDSFDSLSMRQNYFSAGTVG